MSSHQKNISSSASDAELATLYYDSGDMELLAELYKRYMDRIYGVCLQYLKDTEQARDAVMNIFEELITKMRQHRVEHVKSWLHTLARNHCLMQLRTPKNLKTVEIDDRIMQNEEGWHLNGVFEKEEQLNQLQLCMEQLPSKQQITIRLFYLKQKSYQEITEETGLPWNQVRSFIQNGRRNLKICMDTHKNPEA